MNRLRANQFIANCCSGAMASPKIATLIALIRSGPLRLKAVSALRPWRLSCAACSFTVIAC